ncbi:hypothetical protein EPUS_02859 [Endocarpon pusillum Z07020]|uniref:DNA-directed RNA polymerase III subunit RPC6 n=1 Tax=Endocarpon pusillum (strain Z07020 / HMAS-L-300199) TaxID=1263415 RepID=U1G5G4_ENDPU|nr:uncharacterized protein EPUS_02859 [Endocarpon pusillum Z07020]ERF72577.1 hypothetical protein EPUS_02859 [Endocarpon pusillum Z07020]
MAPKKSTAPPTPGPSASTAKDLRVLTVNLYNWCRVNYDEEHILSQQDLLAGDVIPNKDPNLLLAATQSLINDRLFRTHDLRSGGIGWKIVSHVSAQKYKDLSSDESLVYSVIESLGRAGAWVKTIKGKLNLHQKNVDQSIKTLLQRGYIKSMSTVKFPQRKMYILAGLQPGEDATGGAWFTDGVLDHELLEELARTLERRISDLSWNQITNPAAESTGSKLGVSQKRKRPDDGFDSTTKDKGKVRRMDTDNAGDELSASSSAHADIQHRPTSKKQHVSVTLPEKIYVPYPAGYSKYPTLKYLTDFVNDNKILQSGKITESNISQLLEVMVYDDNITKIKATPDGSAPTMYKARKNPTQIVADWDLAERLRDTTRENDSAMQVARERELSKLGSGGMTEIPCGRCPVFDMCEVGGPVNPDNCEYFEEWFLKIESTRIDQEHSLVW